MKRPRLAPGFAALAFFVAWTSSASAQTIIDAWSSVTTPPAPALKPVTVEPHSTALLMLDFLQQNCASNPRCVATLPAAQKLLEGARGSGAAVVYSDYPGGGAVLPQVAPKNGEPLVTAFLDKFMRMTKDGMQDTGLNKILKDKSIKTVIIVGSAANGAVLYTATSAFFLGFETIIPVDGMSGRNAYVEQEVVYNFVSVPVLGGKVTLTRADLIGYKQ